MIVFYKKISAIVDAFIAWLRTMASAIVMPGSKVVSSKQSARE